MVCCFDRTINCSSQFARSDAAQDAAGLFVIGARRQSEGGAWPIVDLVKLPKPVCGRVVRMPWNITRCGKSRSTRPPRSLESYDDPARADPRPTGLQGKHSRTS